ncbi:alpha/beta fold hydrolase [Streptomyces sp. NEAU-S77]|uniref:alpha/beta fold hydrolase n=1 Tax=Streptomyces sp. NEAU-S77 TaxID=3411033 RepID=UPI003BA3AF6D
MPRLAEHFRIVAVDPRGVGPSDKPRDGYDTGTVAAELVALMRALGHERFAMAGHDVGMWIGYALAADHGAAVRRRLLRRNPRPRPRGAARQLRVLPGYGRQHRPARAAQAAPAPHARPRRRRSPQPGRTPRRPARPGDRTARQRRASGVRALRPRGEPGRAARPPRALSPHPDRS